MFRTTGRLTSPSWQTICSTVSPSGVDASSWVLGTSAQEGGDSGCGGCGGPSRAPLPPSVASPAAHISATRPRDAAGAPARAPRGRGPAGLRPRLATPPAGRPPGGAHEGDPTPGRGGRVGQGTLRAGAGGHPTRTANPTGCGRRLCASAHTVALHAGAHLRGIRVTIIIIICSRRVSLRWGDNIR